MLMVTQPCSSSAAASATLTASCKTLVTVRVERSAAKSKHERPIKLDTLAHFDSVPSALRSVRTGFCINLLTVRLRISIPHSFHNHVAFCYSLQTFDQLPPADVTIVAQHGDRRYATALYDHIALRHILDAAHLAHAIFQPAAQAQRGIAKSLEETQETALDRGCRAGSAQRGNILHRGLTDAARIFARAARDACIEAHRLPVDEFERLDLGVDAAGDVAE